MDIQEADPDLTRYKLEEYEGKIIIHEHALSVKKNGANYEFQDTGVQPKTSLSIFVSTDALNFSLFTTNHISSSFDQEPCICHMCCINHDQFSVTS